MYMKTALLIIDVQMAMFSSINGTAVYDGEAVLENICQLIAKARKAGVPVIFIQHTNDQDEEYAEGKSTWQLHPQLQPLATEKVLRKSTRDSFYNTSLQKELNQIKIHQLVIAGMQTEYCVNATLLKALELGYGCVMVEDAHTTFDRSDISAEQIIKQHNQNWKNSSANLLPARDIKFQ